MGKLVAGHKVWRVAAVVAHKFVVLVASGLVALVGIRPAGRLVDCYRLG